MNYTTIKFNNAMKQKEILRLSRSINKLDGKGSDRLKWAVYRTDSKLQKEMPSIMQFIEKLKPKRLAYLQKLQGNLLQKCKTESEREKTIEEWKHSDELESELQKFVDSKKYQDFLNSDNEEFKPYPIELSEDDLEGVKLNNETFWVLERIGIGLEKVME
jgi:Zn-dependent oligopeptidase